jgi:cyanophycin synthetase
MHLNPAIGQSIDVTEKIFEHLFPRHRPCRIPIITFNRLPTAAIASICQQILAQHPQAQIGIVNSEGIWINRSPKVFHADYNSNIQRLLRHPQLDLLVAEYPDSILLRDGMIYEGSELIILDEPTEIELTLVRDLTPQGTVILKQNQKITVKTGNLTTSYDDSSELWSELCLNAIARLLS